LDLSDYDTDESMERARVNIEAGKKLAEAEGRAKFVWRRAWKLYIWTNEYRAQ